MRTRPVRKTWRPKQRGIVVGTVSEHPVAHFDPVRNPDHVLPLPDSIARACCVNASVRTDLINQQTLGARYVFICQTSGQHLAFHCWRNDTLVRFTDYAASHLTTPEPTAVRASRLAVRLMNTSPSDKVGGTVQSIVAPALEFVWTQGTAGAASLTAAFLDSVDQMLSNHTDAKSFSNAELLHTRVIASTPTSISGMRQWVDFNTQATGQSVMADAAAAMSRASLGCIVLKINAAVDNTWQLTINSQVAAIYPSNSLPASLQRETPQQHEARLAGAIQRAREARQTATEGELERGRSRTPKPPGLIPSVGVA
jgi:hypothetical protein